MSTGNHPARWRRIDGARPLLAWSEAQLGAIARLVEGAHQAWQAAWSLPRSSSVVTCAAAREQDLAGAWQFAGAAGAASAWIDVPSCFDDELRRCLWDSDGPVGPIATRIALACRADWQVRLLAGLRMQPAASPAPGLPGAGGAWSGLVRVTLPAGARLLLDATAVEHLRSFVPELAFRPPAAAAVTALAPVPAAMAGVRLPLQVRLADCELDLASLQDLRIGDVVPVPHRLDAPLRVCDARDDVVFTGYLARQGGRKALELAGPSGPQPH